MPNARVGAMPNSQAGNDTREGMTKKRLKDRSRKKGITMEDLKKQTALRLAREERRRNASESRATSSNVHSQDPNQLNLVQSTTIEMTVSCDNSVSSCSYQNSPHYAKAVDDFPHSRFDFISKDHLSGPVGKQQMDMYQSPTNQAQTHHQHRYHHHHQSPQNFKTEKYHHGGHIFGSGGKYANHNHPYSIKSTHSAGSGSVSSKLPHGLTVQELKEMTRARLAAEAAELKEKNSWQSDDPESSQQPQTYSGPRTRIYSHESRDNSIGRDSNGRPMVSTSDSFGSQYVERQRLGSLESFGSARSTYTGSGYHGKGILTASLSNDQPPLTSFSYDAMDNESCSSAVGSESIFGSETHCSKTSKYTANSSVYRIPYSTEKSPTTPTCTKFDAALWSDPFVRSTSPVPTITNSTTSEHENSSFFKPSNIGKMERMVSAGAVVPNSVAESVLGSSDDNLGTHLDLYGSSVQSPSALVSPNDTVPHISPWSKPRSYNGEGEVDDGIAKLQSEWNTFLNIDSNGGEDDFPLSTFTSKFRVNQPAQSHANHYESPSFFSSPFQTVPEERAVQNLMSRDDKVESFVDDEQPSVPKNSMWRNKVRD